MTMVAALLADKRRTGDPGELVSERERMGDQAPKFLGIIEASGGLVHATTRRIIEHMYNNQRDAHAG
jgi:hypothetical protein